MPVVLLLLNNRFVQDCGSQSGCVTPSFPQRLCHQSLGGGVVYFIIIILNPLGFPGGRWLFSTEAVATVGSFYICSSEGLPALLSRCTPSHCHRFLPAAPVELALLRVFGVVLGHQTLSICLEINSQGCLKNDWGQKTWDRV